MNAPALLVAGTHSGCGKTTVTLGLMAALKRRGLEVRPFKCGPDFIDPSLHELVCGRASRNLDCRMCGEDFVSATFARHNPPGENSVAVVEGVMGLFDGGAGSAAHLAKVLGLPVVLVIDVRSAAESIAAVAHGFATFDPDLPLAGIIGNRVGSARHESLIREAMRRVDAPLVGFLPREEAIAVPSRHLGLHMGGEMPLDAAALDRLAEMMERHLDLDGVLKMAATVKGPLPEGAPGEAGWGSAEGAAFGNVRRAPHPRRSLRQRYALPPPSRREALVRIAIARDAAFCFYYEDNLDMLREAGAELVAFSPLDDARLPENLGGLYLGGGYPELHAARLAENAAMRAAIRDFSAAGRPVFAECGGFMYLCERLRDLEGREYPMCGVFPRACVMRPKLSALGYREAVMPRETFFGPAGTRLFGHEFHYSELLPDPAETEPQQFMQRGDTLAGYIHLHWGRTPEAPAAFARACRAAQP